MPGTPDPRLAELQAFQALYEVYADGILSASAPVGHANLAALRTPLQQMERRTTEILMEVLGDTTYTLDRPGSAIGRSDVIPMALMGGNNAMPHNFAGSHALVGSMLNQAIGVLRSPSRATSARDPSLTYIGYRGWVLLAIPLRAWCRPVTFLPRMAWRFERRYLSRWWAGVLVSFIGAALFWGFLWAASEIF